MQKILYLVIFITVLVVSAFTTIKAQPWIGDSWAYRRLVTIGNPGATELTNYQVKITLDNTFDFTNAKGDGSDIRITSNDGTTYLPFWIETWDSAGMQATIWVKVPTLPASGLSVYLYYGNPSPVIVPLDPVETAPIGPYTKATGNPIVPIGDAGNGVSLCAENIVYDDATGHYWMVFANYRSGQSVGLVWSDDPTNPDAWNWDNGSVIPLANAPHIMGHNNTWYIFYADRTTPSPWSIYVASSSNVNGPYTVIGPVLAPGAPGSWESYRVDEPYVFQRNDGKWILTYMGDAGGPLEQIGYAESDNILGPYTKFTGNPCIAFGPSGSHDAGTAADPWVYEYEGVYYIGYTVSPTVSSPWQTALATTTDWQTFTKHGVILPYSPEFNAFRGAVIRIDNEYVFSYTTKMTSSSPYQMAIATQPVFMAPPNIINNGNVVFDFYDNFEGTSIDLTKWTFVNGNPIQTIVAGGLLTMTSAVSPNYVRIFGSKQFGMDFIGETRARHPNQGTLNLIGEVGFADAGWNTIRIVDDFPSTTNWQRQAKFAGPDVFVDMAQTSDQNWHEFRLYRESPGTAGFQIDDNPVEPVNTNVPTMNLPPFLMSYGSGNQFIVDWTRVRKWAGVEPTTLLGSEESNPLPVELSSFTASTIGSTVKLIWRTETEVNNYGFEVERNALSLQSQVTSWEKIGFVNGNGNSNSPKNYIFEEDGLLPGKYSYRLKQIDNDGQFEYSKTVEVSFMKPNEFTLEQNYPNPFNPVTTIRYNIPESGNVKLTLFNILGQELRTLVNEFQESGMQTINFDASELNSGMYIYKLESGSLVQTRKMILLK